jgi:flagellar assembly protein FliH
VEEKSLSKCIKLHRAPVRATVLGLAKASQRAGSQECRQEFDVPTSRENWQGANDSSGVSLPADSSERMYDAVERARAEERERVEQFLASLEEQFRQVKERFEENVIKCALAVAERIVKREIARDQEFVLTQVREALKRVVGVSRIQLRVHPSDETLLQSRRAGLMEASDSLREISIEADETIEPGGCIVESESGSVDAQLSTQLQQIEEALLADSHS